MKANRRILIIAGVIVFVIVFLDIKITYGYSFELKVTGNADKHLILIPGLTCPGDVWNETVQRYSKEYTCHVISLPGFAGRPPIATDNYLEAMRNEIILYIKENKLKKPILMGHSLGGFLSLWIGVIEPTLTDQIIVVDALPYFPAIQNPATTVETTKPMAENMRKMMASATPAQVEQNQQFFLSSMVTAPEKQELIGKWGLDSHQPTVAQAMYEMQTIDLRQSLASIKANMLVLGAWIAYKNYGVTRESTLKNFSDQYQLATCKEIKLTDTAKHFIMYDDPQWFFEQTDVFLLNN